MQPDRTSASRFFLPVASGILLLALCLAWWMNSRQPTPVSLTPTLTGQPEYCLTCHADLPEISPSHPVQTFGCVICHGGERLALNADVAHSSMRGGQNPSDLSVVEQSCGGSNCHSGSAADNNDHVQRVMSSVQSTYAGAIASILYTFGAEPDLTARFGMHAVSDQVITTQTGVAALEAFDPIQYDHSIIEDFGQNCLTCHINAIPRDGVQYARETGCAACHTPDVNAFPEGQVHRLTTEIPYTQCNTCHNRGNYDLGQMTFVERADQPTTRLQSYYQPIAQFTRCEWTLDCVDCHTRTEAMGDDDIHSNMKDIQYIQCKTCHGTLTELPQTKTLTDPNDIAFRLAQLNPVVDLKLGDTILVTEQGEPLWNTRVLSDGTYELIGKVTKQRFAFRPVMGTGCQQIPDQQASQYCHQCHAVEH
ncbi:MAG TPA: hypothetical protein VI451_15450 [Anaerolineales bacterium]|nr:hypothetical protein [Anaerolineales bacterium]